MTTKNATKATTVKTYSRVLSCGHEKAWDGTRWVANPICPECSAEAGHTVYRKVNSLWEKVGKSWKEVTITAAIERRGRSANRAA